MRLCLSASDYLQFLGETVYEFSDFIGTDGETEARKRFAGKIASTDLEPDYYLFSFVAGQHAMAVVDSDSGPFGIGFRVLLAELKECVSYSCKDLDSAIALYSKTDAVEKEVVWACARDYQGVNQ
jgi:hypothetical protein